MRSIKMDFVRSGGATGTLIEGTTYHVVTESSRHRELRMPLDQNRFLKLLAEMRYHELVTEEQRQAALMRLSEVVTEILQPSDLKLENGVQIDLVTDARELWALPFEAALAPDGQPLLARRDAVVVLTRRAPQEFAAHQPHWPARPRILFAHASPDWIDAARVPASVHKEALLQALQPWVDPLPDLPLIVGREESVLTTLVEASLADIQAACRRAEAEKKPYTHIHLLAHGIKIEDPIYSHEVRYGVALRSDERIPATPEGLVEALRSPRSPGEPRPEMPLVVTLAICDGGNAANTIIEAGGVAQELHRAGVPIVIASQLPLTFPGSEVMTRVFYASWMEGQDVRTALHATRVALQETEEARHDWVSLVAYVRLPEGYSSYLLEVSLASQLAALETASSYARHLIDHDIKEGLQYEQVTERLSCRAERLEELLQRHEAAALKPQKEVIQENAGLLGSAYKRLAELLYWRAGADPENRERWLHESRTALEKARNAYCEGFRRDTYHHWSGVQYLALDAVLNGEVSVADWYACYVAAAAERDSVSTAEKDRIWALGSIMELYLLSPLVPGLQPPAGNACLALADLCSRSQAVPNLFLLLSPIESTRRQLRRYEDWWTRGNGFFGTRDRDCVKEAATLIEQIEATMREKESTPMQTPASDPL